MEAMGIGVMLAGIGGTGVITVSAVLAMAAHMQGFQASVYDMTGASQKNGAVLSHLRMSSYGTPIPTATIGMSEAHLVLAFDLVASLLEESFRTMREGTKVLGNDRVQPTAALIRNADEKVNKALLARRIEDRVGAEHADYVDATGIAIALCGDAIAANFFLVGVALQRGWLPLRLAAIQRAIELNGVQVQFNLHALRLGRLWVHNRTEVERLLTGSNFVPEAPEPLDLDELLADRATRLTAYQNGAYSHQYLAALAEVRAAESRVVPGSTRLTEAAAKSLYRVAAYKDEYEVARLHSDPAFLRQLALQFEPGAKLRFNLAPPLLARRDPQTGFLVKREFGSWIKPVFSLLARMKVLRNTPFDVFGYTAERRAERALLKHQLALLKRIASELTAANHDIAVQLAGVAEKIRGYGHIKEASMHKTAAIEKELLDQFTSAREVPARDRAVA
jgi:indolepyruvate ferredoxin oxidoreductase